jgi:hypothetical protein
VRAWRRAGATEGDDVRDLGERQAESTGSGDEREQRKDVEGIRTVAGPCAPRVWQDASSLIQTQRFARYAALGGQLSDQERFARHIRKDRPYPVGQGQAP